MVKLRLFVVIISSLLSGVASAQFANKSLGLGLGYLSISADPSVGWGVPLSLEASLYLESSFEGTMRVPLMVLVDKTNGNQVVAAGLNVGVRYLFSEESTRPYAGLEIATLYIHREALTSFFAGLQPSVGLDVFLNDALSLGGRVFANFYLMLNQPVRIGLGGQAVIATHF